LRRGFPALTDITSMPEPSDPKPDDLPTPRPPPSRVDAAVEFGFGVIGGLVLFFLGGWLVLSFRNQSVGGAYLVLAAGVAFAGTIRPGTRGLALGIFLGLGGILLLLAICSGMKV
jgi:hypothetical protein